MYSLILSRIPSPIRRALRELRVGGHDLKCRYELSREALRTKVQPTLSLENFTLLGEEMKRLSTRFDPNPHYPKTVGDDHPWCSPMVKKAFDFILANAKPGTSVLDVGGGPGNLGLMLNAKGYTEYLVVDRMWRRLLWGSLLWRRFGKTFRYREENALAMTSADASYNFVTLLDWENPDTSYPLILRECTRVLKPGGHLIFSYRDIDEVIEGDFDYTGLSPISNSAISGTAIRKLCEKLRLKVLHAERGFASHLFPAHIVFARKLD